MQNYHDALSLNDQVALDSSKRTIVRVRELLDKLKATTKSEVWLYEISAYVNDEMGWREEVFEDLMKEYRTLQAVSGWEEDTESISRMTNLVKEIYSHHKSVGTKASLFKCKLLVNGVVKKVRTACCDSDLPKEVEELDKLLAYLESDIATANAK